MVRHGRNRGLARGTTPSARCTGICTFPGQLGTTASGSRKYRWAIRESGGVASPIGGFVSVLPDPHYAPGYPNEFGGHFVITQEMREQSEKFRQRLRSRRE